jgi:hypothetical protein
MASDDEKLNIVRQLYGAWIPSTEQKPEPKICGRCSQPLSQSEKDDICETKEGTFHKKCVIFMLQLYHLFASRDEKK